MSQIPVRCTRHRLRRTHTRRSSRPPAAVWPKAVRRLSRVTHSSSSRICTSPFWGPPSLLPSSFSYSLLFTSLSSPFVRSSPQKFPFLLLLRPPSLSPPWSSHSRHNNDSHLCGFGIIRRILRWYRRGIADAAIVKYGTFGDVTRKGNCGSSRYIISWIHCESIGREMVAKMKGSEGKTIGEYLPFMCSMVRPDKEWLTSLNEWAHLAEGILHGRASGIDNTISCFGGTPSLPLSLILSFFSLFLLSLRLSLSLSLLCWCCQCFFCICVWFTVLSLGALMFTAGSIEHLGSPLKICTFVSFHLTLLLWDVAAQFLCRRSN